MFTSSDEYLIYKRGRDFRVDCKLKSGKTSLLFKDHQLLLVDHRGLTKDLMSELSYDKLEAEADGLIHDRPHIEVYKATDLRFVQAKDWLGNLVVSQIGSWTAAKCNASCSMKLHQTNKPVHLDLHLLEVKTFDEYLTCTKLSRAASLSPSNSNSASTDLKVSVWTCAEFPMRVKDFSPIVELLSTVSRKARMLKELLADELPMTLGFPIKLVFPVLWTVKAVATLTDFSQDPVDPSLFNCSSSAAYLENLLNSEEGQSDILYSDESTGQAYPEYEEPSDSEEELARAHKEFMTLSPSSSDRDDDCSEIFEEDCLDESSWPNSLSILAYWKEDTTQRGLRVHAELGKREHEETQSQLDVD
jgi:hypothetical protein